MNSRNDFFLFLDDRGTGRLEGFRPSISTIWKRYFVEFDKFLTNWFFMFEKRINIFKNLRKSSTRKPPSQLVFSVILSSVNEVQLATESLRKPFENRSFSVVALKNDLINKIGSIFRLPFLNIKRTFGVNETCQICEIVNGWCDSISNRLKLFFMMLRDKIAYIFEDLHLANKRIFHAYIVRFSKIYSYHAFFSFFNKINKNILSKFNCISFPYGILVKAFFVSVSFSNKTHTSTKKLFKVVQDRSIYRRNGNRDDRLSSKPRFGFNASNVKTPVTINVSSNISIISLFNFLSHAIIMAGKMLKSSKVTDMDNPTEITRTDIDRVTTVLRGNDAIFFEREVHGSNRFGSAPIRNAFFGLCHTDVIERLNNVVGYKNSAQYSNPYTPLPSEEGSAGNIRFLVSSQGSISPNASGIGGADVYNIFVLGKKAVGLCELDGYSTKFIYHPPRLNGPLELSHTAGYKLSWGARILQDLHVQNLRCTL